MIIKNVMTDFTEVSVPRNIEHIDMVYIMMILLISATLLRVF
jgi:hypothetical protein